MARLEKFELTEDGEDFEVTYGRIPKKALIGSEITAIEGGLDKYGDIAIRCKNGRVLHLVTGDGLSICEWKHEQPRDDPTVPGERTVSKNEPKKGCD